MKNLNNYNKKSQRSKEVGVNKYLPDFLIVPGLIAFDKNLKPLDLIVYGVVYWLEHLSVGRCIASNRFLAQIVGCHPKSIQKSLANLEKRGYILKVYNEEKERKEIKCLVAFNFINPEVIKSAPTPHRQMTPPPPPNGSHISKSNISKRNINIIKTNPKVTTGLSSVEELSHHKQTDLLYFYCKICKLRIPSDRRSPQFTDWWVCLDCEQKAENLKKQTVKEQKERERKQFRCKNCGSLFAKEEIFIDEGKTGLCYRCYFGQSYIKKPQLPEELEKMKKEIGKPFVSSFEERAKMDELIAKQERSFKNKRKK